MPLTKEAASLRFGTRRAHRPPRSIGVWLTMLLIEQSIRPAASSADACQKQVEFARALMQKARLVLLDEPMAGMSTPEKTAMTALIKRVQQQYGMSFLIVEHDIPVIMDISDKIVVLDFGRKIAEGSPTEVQANEVVITAYLCTEH
jgi:ABC-type branched-subunit amino acid transport system ATPase component